MWIPLDCVRGAVAGELLAVRLLIRRLTQLASGVPLGRQIAWGVPIIVPGDTFRVITDNKWVAGYLKGTPPGSSSVSLQPLIEATRLEIDVFEELDQCYVVVVHSLRNSTTFQWHSHRVANQARRRGLRGLRPMEVPTSWWPSLTDYRLLRPYDT